MPVRIVFSSCSMKCIYTWIIHLFGRSFTTTAVIISVGGVNDPASGAINTTQVSGAVGGVYGADGDNWSVRDSANFGSAHSILGIQISVLFLTNFDTVSLVL